MPMTGIPSIVLFSIGSAVLAMAGFFAVRKLTKPVNLDEHQTFLDAMCNIVGTLVSILLGLLVAASLDTYQNLEQTIDQEANCAAEIFRMSRGLPDPVQGHVQTLAEKYCMQVVNLEWPAMSKGKLTREVFRTTVELTDAIVRFRPANDGESNVQASMLQSVQTLGNCRRARMLALTSTRNQILLPLLVICAVTVMIFTYLYVKHVSTLQAVLIGCVAVALGGNISLVFLLSKPFDGDWKLQPRGFILNLKALHEIYQSGIFKPAAGTYVDPQTHVLKMDPAYARAHGIQLRDDMPAGADFNGKDLSTSDDGYGPGASTHETPLPSMGEQQNTK